MPSWRKAAPMSIARSHCAAAAWGGLLYVFGGGGPGFVSLDTVEVYDPRRDRWEPLPPMPGMRSGLVAAPVGGRIYVIGGGFRRPEDGSFNFLRVVEAYDPKAGAWEQGPELIHRHDAPGCAWDADSIYILGGHHPDATGGPLTDPALDGCESWAAPEGRWRALPPLGTPRFSLGAAFLGGQLWAMGGGAFWEGAFRNYDRIERLTPGRQAWEEASLRLPWPSAGPSTAVLENRLYVCGGNSGDRIEPRAARLAPGARGWEDLPPMPEPRAAAAAVAMDGALWLVGGRAADGKTPTATLFCFPP